MKDLFRIWLSFTRLLGKINSFLLLTLFYFFIIGPIALIRKVILRFKKKEVESYWIDCEKNGESKNLRVRVKSPLYILGISCFYHDAAACLLKDGQIVAAAQEERFTRNKHDDNFPSNAIDYCLKEESISVKEISFIGFYDNPFLKFERVLESYIDSFPTSYTAFKAAVSIWLKEKLWIKDLIKKKLNYKGEVYFCEHHLSHAASSFLVSPFKEAAILTADGVGEWATTTFGRGKDSNIEIIKEIRWPDSLGMLYSAFTYYLGFKINDGEYKLMGAAPYGKPKYAKLIKEHLIDIKEDGSFKINLDYFEYHRALRTINNKFEDLFGGPAKDPNDKFDQRHWDVAASIQEVTNEIMLKIANYLYKETSLKNLCLGGGVALNCVANSKILEQTPFERIFIQPAAGDAGGALGVACYLDNKIFKNGRRTDFPHPYLGPAFGNEEIKKYLEEKKIIYHYLDDKELVKKAAELINKQQVIGWFQGRMEWGPRALGNRSIIADARNKENWQRVNLKIKFRESFRPFAPSVLEEKVEEYFKIPKDVYGDNTPSAYMLLIAKVKGGNKGIPAVTHVDGSARLQTVSKKQNSLYYQLLKEFESLTGCPVIINTSFNVRDEPIVCTPDDAFKCFVRTQMDYLVIGNYLLNKKEMKKELDKRY